jgi:Flp pilus assembly pilin Flp
MKSIANFVAAIWKDESGITSVEYAVLLALGVGGVIIGVEILDGTAQSGSGWATVR